MRLSAVMLCADVCDEKGACVCVRGRRWLQPISACFWRVCGKFYGAASCWDGKGESDKLWMGIVVLKMCVLSFQTTSCSVEVATKRSETRRNPAVAPDAPSPSYACPFLRPCTRAIKTTQYATHDAGKRLASQQVESIQKCLSPSEASPRCRDRRNPPAQVARQEREDDQGDGADEHR